MQPNYKQIYAIQNANKERIKKVCENAKDESGIYVFLRREEGLKFAYIGQAKKVLSRLAQHLSGYSRIDLSIKKRGFYSSNNLTGWQVYCSYYPENMLDDKEREYIVIYSNNGWQLYNATTGGQDEHKKGLKETVRKGYQEGLHNGYEKARKEVSHWFKLHLDYNVKKQGNKNQEKALKKFEEFIGIGDE